MNEQRKKLSIALVSIHGLIRGDNLELGRDADTGGQTLYVLELAQALARCEEVEKVDKTSENAFQSFEFSLLKFFNV